MWYGRPLVLQHPDARQRLPCLRCGNFGHTVARWRYTESQLTGPGSRVAAELEVARLEDLAKPFASLDEMKQIAARRLALQEEADRKAQAALQPHQERNNTSPWKAEDASAHNGPGDGRSNAATQARQVVDPEPKKPWIAVPLGKGRSLLAHKESLQQKFKVARSRYADLQYPDEDEEDTDSVTNEDRKTVDRPPRNGVIEVSSEDEVEEKAPVPLTEEDKEKLHLVIPRSIRNLS